jgi:hypothetical protein
MGGGFWLLPAPFDSLALDVLTGFLFLVAPPLVARAKGFRWWPWAVPSGLLGFPAVFLLPSARAPGLAAAERAARAWHGSWVGVAQAIVGGAALVAGVARAVARG